MPRRIKNKENREYESDIKFKRQLIRENLLNCFNIIEKRHRQEQEPEVNLLIKQHWKFINSLELKGKHKNIYKTLEHLKHYNNTKNKSLAFITLYNTLIRWR